MADSTEDSHDGSKTLSERLEELDRTLADWAPLRWASFKLGVKPSVIAAGCVLWMSCFLLWGFSGELICTLVAYIYPAFASFKALEEAGSGDGTAGIDHWLRYWLTYACSMLAERVLYTLLTWIPFYHLVRLLYIVWLFLPSTNGAQLVYAWAIAPVLRHQWLWFRLAVVSLWANKEGNAPEICPPENSKAHLDDPNMICIEHTCFGHNLEETLWGKVVCRGRFREDSLGRDHDESRGVLWVRSSWANPEDDSAALSESGLGSPCGTLGNVRGL